MASIGTDVRFMGLKARTDLNGTDGTVAGEWDGVRYTIRDHTGAFIRVLPANFVPVHRKDFTVFERRISHELLVFAHYHHDENTSLIPLDRCALENPGRATCATLSFVEICTKGSVLRLYKDGEDTPYAQVRPLTTDERAPEPTIHITVHDYDTLQLVSDLEAGTNADWEKARTIAITCRGAVYTFSNRYPRFHLPLAVMTNYMTKRMQMALVSNISDLVKHSTRPLDDVSYMAECRLLLFRISGVAHRVVSFMWDHDCFYVARNVNMTEHRMNICARIGNVMPQDDPTSYAIFPMGAHAILNSKTVVVSKMIDRTSVVLKDGRVVSQADLQHDPGTFLCVQLLVAGQFYDFLERRFHATHGADAVPPAQLNVYRDMLTAMHAIVNALPTDGRIVNEHTHFMLRENVPDMSNGKYMLDFSSMNKISNTPDMLTAWMANMEAVATVLTLFAELPVARDGFCMRVEGNILRLSIGERGRIFRVGGFVANPLLMQRRIFDEDKCDGYGTANCSDDEALERVMEHSMFSQSNDRLCRELMKTLLGDDAASKLPFRLTETSTETRGAMHLYAEDLVGGRAARAKPTTTKAATDAGNAAQTAQLPHTAIPIAPNESVEDLRETAIEKSMRLQRELIDEEEKRPPVVDEETRKKKNKKSNGNGKKNALHRQKTTDAFPEQTMVVNASAGIDASVVPSEPAEATHTTTTSHVHGKPPSAIVLHDDADVRKTTDDDDSFTVVIKTRAMRSLRDELDEARREAVALRASLEKSKACERLLRDDVAVQLAASKSAELSKKEAERARDFAVSDNKKSVHAHSDAIASAHHEIDSLRHNFESTVDQLTNTQRELSELKEKHETYLKVHCEDAHRASHRVLAMLLKQIDFYKRGSYMKLDERALSIDSMLVNGLAAKTMMEFYRIVNPQFSDNREVLHELARVHAERVSIDGNRLLVT